MDNGLILKMNEKLLHSYRNNLCANTELPAFSLPPFPPLYTQACLGMYSWVSFFFFFPILQCYSLSLICEKTLLLYLSTHFTSPYDSFFMRGNCFCPNMLVRQRLQIYLFLPSDTSLHTSLTVAFF